MTELYCLDTSVLIESWNNLYRPKSFPSFWEKIRDGFEQKQFISPWYVLNEIEKKDDDLYKWTKNISIFFYLFDENLEKEQTIIINKFRRLIDQGKGRSMCDPWVIALAKIHKCPVVSQEYPKSDENPKIPDVCRNLDLRCIKIADLIEEMGWIF